MKGGVGHGPTPGPGIELLDRAPYTKGGGIPSPGTAPLNWTQTPEEGKTSQVPEAQLRAPNRDGGGGDRLRGSENTPAPGRGGGGKTPGRGSRLQTGQFPRGGGGKPQLRARPMSRPVVPVRSPRPQTGEGAAANRVEGGEGGGGRDNSEWRQKWAQTFKKKTTKKP